MGDSDGYSPYVVASRLQSHRAGTALDLLVFVRPATWIKMTPGLIDE